MRFISNNGKSIASSSFLLVVLVALGLSLTFAKASDRKRCGLHAGIHAQFVAREPGVTHPAYVMLTFLLLNHSKTPLDAEAGSWTLVIDGVELKESPMIFGNGPMPAEGYKTLRPGDHYEFGKGLELSRYFPHAGLWKISWRGKSFESPTITLKIDATAP